MSIVEFPTSFLGKNRIGLHPPVLRISPNVSNRYKRIGGATQEDIEVASAVYVLAMGSLTGWGCPAGRRGTTINFSCTSFRGREVAH